MQTILVKRLPVSQSKLLIEQDKQDEEESGNNEEEEFDTNEEESGKNEEESDTNEEQKKQDRAEKNRRLRLKHIQTKSSLKASRESKGTMQTNSRQRKNMSQCWR